MGKIDNFPIVAYILPIFDLKFSFGAFPKSYSQLLSTFYLLI